MNMYPHVFFKSIFMIATIVSSVNDLFIKLIINRAFYRKVSSQLSTKTTDIGIMVGVFANASGDMGSSRVIPKTQKMETDASLLNTQNYKVRIKGKVG